VRTHCIYGEIVLSSLSTLDCKGKASSLILSILPIFSEVKLGALRNALKSPVPGTRVAPSRSTTILQPSIMSEYTVGQYNACSFVILASYGALQKAFSEHGWIVFATERFIGYVVLPSASPTLSEQRPEILGKSM
jgi:hypothetical protein